MSEIKINNNEKTYVNSSEPQTVKLLEVKSYMDFNGLKICFLRKFNWFHKLMIRLFFGLKIYNVGSDSKENDQEETRWI